MKTCSYIAIVVALLSGGLAADEACPRETFGAGHAIDPGQLPASAIKRQLDHLPAPARARALQRLKAVHFHREDCNHLHVDHHGNPFFLCSAPADEVAAPGAEPVAAPLVAAAGVPVASGVPVRHSRPGATNVIYLDFNGATITGTAWNDSLGRATIEAIAYDTNDDPSTFSDVELTAIDRIWKRVAEDFCPFEVDVTT